MRILFAAGGTAGHINPAIAVAEYLKMHCDDTEILFACVPGGMEERLVPQAGFQTTPINIRGLKRSFSLENIHRIAMIPAALRRADAIVKDFSPDVVFATGGYLSYPIVKAAKHHGIPCILHESNAVPGISVKLLSGKANCVLLNYQSAKQYLNKKCHTVYVGNPLRHAFQVQTYSHARRKLNIPDNTFVILSFGGSLGASRLNECCALAMHKLNKQNRPVLWFHATGKEKYEEMKKFCHEHELVLSDNVKLYPYLDDIPLRMASADLVISRAGAVTLTELSALGKASVLIPFPGAAANHQMHNAEVLKNENAAMVIPDNSLSGEELYDTIIFLLNDKNRRKKLSENIRQFYNPNVLLQIHKIIEKCL